MKAYEKYRCKMVKVGSKFDCKIEVAKGMDKFI